MKLKFFKRRLSKSQISTPCITRTSATQSSGNSFAAKSGATNNGTNGSHRDFTPDFDECGTVLIHSNSYNDILDSKEQEARNARIEKYNKYNSFSIETDLKNTFRKQEAPIVDLIQSLNSNRSKLQARYYIYDKEAFERAILEGSTEKGESSYRFDIFNKAEGINHCSCRYVIHGLIKHLKSVLNSGLFSPCSLFDIFAPNLQQLKTENLLISKAFIQEMFPHDGCSLRGAKLDKIIAETDILIILISLRVILSLLPGGLISGQDYETFIKQEEAENYTKSSFYSLLPLCLPSNNHPYILQEFLDLLVTVWCNVFNEDAENNYDKSYHKVMEIIHVASSLCFQSPHDDSDKGKDIYFFKQFYSVRNHAFQRIFHAYLRNIIHEGKLNAFMLPEGYFSQPQLQQYPPLPYRTSFVEYALVISVPKHKLPRFNASLDDLVHNICTSKATVYSAHDVLYFDEGVFLRKFCADPYRTLQANTSELSLKYLKRFDNNPKLLNKINRANKDRSQLWDHGDNDGELNEIEESYEVEDATRVSKLVMSEWFFNTWKYETSIGNLTSTFIFELKHKVGQVNWLIISSDDQERGSLHSEENCVDPEMILAENKYVVNKNIEDIYSADDDTVSDTKSSRRKLKPAPIIDCNNQDSMFVISEAEELEVAHETRSSDAIQTKKEQSAAFSYKRNYQSPAKLKVDQLDSLPTNDDVCARAMSSSSNTNTLESVVSLPTTPKNTVFIKETITNLEYDKNKDNFISSNVQIIDHTASSLEVDICNYFSTHQENPLFQELPLTPQKNIFTVDGANEKAHTVTRSTSLRKVSIKAKKRRHSERELTHSSYDAEQEKNSDATLIHSSNTWTAGTTMNSATMNGETSMMKTSPRCSSLKELLVG